MPAPLPPSGVFGQEWDRFWAGYARLDPDSVESIRDQLARDRLPPDRRDVVNVPGLRDFIVYPNRYTIEERREIANQIRGAPDSIIAASWGRMLTALDNVQDILVSVGLLGWLVTRVAPQVFGRALPVVGTVLLISDLLALLTILGQAASPLYALWCLGIGAGLAAAVPAMLFGALPKSLLWRLGMAGGAGRRGFFRSAPTSILRPSGLTLLSPGEAQRRRVQGLGPFRWSPLAWQLPQATSTIFGWGISLGGAVGLITGGAAAAAGAAEGRKPRVQLTPGGQDLFRLINRPLTEDHPADLWMLTRAAVVMRDVPTVLRYPEYVSGPQYVQCLLALLAAQRIVFRRLHGYPYHRILAEALDAPARLAASIPTRLQGEYETLGLAPGDPLAWDTPESPIQITLGEWVATAAPEIAAGTDRWLAWHRHDTLGVAGGTLINQLTDELWPQLVDDDEPIRWELTPDWAILAAHAENHRVPALVGDLQRLWTYWQDLRAEHARRPVGKWTPATFDAFATKHGVKLITLLPPNAPLAPEWQRFFESMGHHPPARNT